MIISRASDYSSKATAGVLPVQVPTWSIFSQIHSLSSLRKAKIASMSEIISIIFLVKLVVRQINSMSSIWLQK